VWNRTNPFCIACIVLSRIWYERAGSKVKDSGGIINKALTYFDELKETCGRDRLWCFGVHLCTVLTLDCQDVGCTIQKRVSTPRFFVMFKAM